MIWCIQDVEHLVHGAEPIGEVDSVRKHPGQVARGDALRVPILHHVEAAGPEPREQHLERRPRGPEHVRGVVDDQIEAALGQVRVNETGQRRSVALVEAERSDHAAVKVVGLDELGEQRRDLCFQVDCEQLATYFKLNTDRLREFHEQLGLKYNAYTSSGWDDLIQDTFRQQIENALQEETRRSDVAELYGDADLLVAIQERVQATLSQRLRDALGGQFFCAPTFEPGGECTDPIFVIKAIEIPESVRKAFESNRTSQVQIATKRNEVTQRQAEAEGIQALSAALAAAGDDYVLLKAIESGKISFWVLPSDSGVTLTTPDPGADETTTTTTAPASGGG